MTATDPTRTAPMPPWPHFADDEIAAAESVLRSGRVNYWTGEEGRKFEEEFAASIGVRHAVAVANGTVAIELALEALDIGPGDDVILTCRTFIASASAVVMRGARPVLVDVDPDAPLLEPRPYAPPAPGAAAAASPRWRDGALCATGPSRVDESRDRRPSSAGAGGADGKTLAMEPRSASRCARRSDVSSGLGR